MHRLDLWGLCCFGCYFGCFDGCVKVARILEGRTLTMSVKMQLRFWCAVDVLGNQT